ncbi:MAG: DUF4956 domain-containing protein [Rikenellaceae bacterium]
MMGLILEPLFLAIGSMLSACVDWIESIKFLGIKIVDVGDFAELLFRFALNVGVLLLIIKYIYLRHNRRRNFTFSYVAVGMIVFLLCFLLNSVKLELGFALGLFAVFGIIRYRTDGIPFKDMTYLFVFIGISVVNALANKKVSYLELMFTNAAIYGGLWLLEKFLSVKHEDSIKVVYENISNVNLERYDVLLEDLKKRTGFDIKRFEIKKIDYLKDVAIISIYFVADEHICLPEQEESED